MVLAHDILLHYYIVYTFLQSYIKIFQRSCIVVVVLVFYVHGKHLRSCRDGFKGVV